MLAFSAGVSSKRTLVLLLCSLVFSVQPQGAAALKTSAAPSSFAASPSPMRRMNTVFTSLFGSSKRRLVSSKPVCLEITNPAPVTDSPSCQQACSRMEGCAVGKFNSEPNMLQCDCSGAGCNGGTRTICTSSAMSKAGINAGIIAILFGAVLFAMQ